MLRGVTDVEVKARKALDEMFKNVVTSEQIIKREDMPEFKLKNMRQNIARLGEATIKNMIDYQTQLNNVRKSTEKLCSTTFAKIPAPVSTACVAITLCGVGECHETANRVLFDLIKQGIKDSVSLVKVEGAFNAFHQSNYDHVFILVGMKNKELKSVEDLSKLGNEVILIDSLLNVVGKANNYKKLIGAYLDTHMMYKVKELNTFDPTRVDHAKIYGNACQLADAVQEDMKKNDYASAAHQSMREVFSNIVNKDSELYTAINHIVGQFDGHEQQDKIKDSLNTNMEAAFRQVCAYGSFDTIIYMLDNQKLLFMFDANEPSPTTGARAKDWVSKNKSLSVAQRNILLIRIATDNVAIYKKFAGLFGMDNERAVTSNSSIHQLKK